MLRTLATCKSTGAIVEDIDTGHVFTIGQTVTDTNQAGRPTGTIAQAAVLADGSMLLTVTYDQGGPVLYSTRHGGFPGWFDAGDLA